MQKRRVVIVGAGGRDFHNFIVFFKNNPNYEVVAFTFASEQVPAELKVFPPELAGPQYPNGIPIYPESQLEKVIKEKKADLVVLSYSDLSFDYIMDIASRAAACGASFMLLGPKDTMLESKKPVVAVCAVRTGAGKSTVSRKVVRHLWSKGYKVSIVRHPMVYMNPANMVVQEFRTIEDLDRWGVTYEEREEYEPYLEMGLPVFAGVDYTEILKKAEEAGDIVLWDGGNNDWPFFKPDLMITVADATRPGHELHYWPGSVNVRISDVIIINKTVTGGFENSVKVEKNIRKVNPRAIIIWAESRITLEPNKPELIEGKKALVIEDAPTVTHGQASFGAGYLAAIRYGAEVIDPKPIVFEKFPNSDLARTYRIWTHTGPVIPSLGYTEKQKKELEEILNTIDADVIINASPINITRIMKLNKPVIHVRYELVEISEPGVSDILDSWIEKMKSRGKL